MTRTTSRRSVLAGTGLAVASAGCVGRVRNIVSREPSDQLMLEIVTVPADTDPNAVRIARHLSEHMNEAGIDTRIDTVNLDDLLRRSLLNHDFDIYVGQFPEAMPFEPDALYSFANSRFAAESGWQNPFGFTELAVDDLLSEQRSAGAEDRDAVLAELQETVCELQPFSVVAFPDAVTAYRDERFDGWEFGHPTSAQGLLRLSYVPPEEREGTDTDTEEDADADESNTLRLTTTDDRITENWNPIAVEYRRHGTFTSMLYDPLVRRHDDGPLPWLAEGWEWLDSETIRIDLREVEWHDGEPLTADDVAFTYEFLEDTSMGEAETPIPTPIFRGRSTIPESVTAVDRSTVELDVGSVNPDVGARALEIPVLPEHIWSDRTELVSIAGIAVDEEITEALVSPNDDPVGSGPIRLVESTAETEVIFERNPDHFLRTLDPLEEVDDDPNPSTGETDTDPVTDARPIPNAYRGKPSFERIVIEVVPSDIAAVQQVGDGLADGTLSNLGPDAVPRVGREADARLVSVRSAAFYHVGYNVRRAPLSNPRFRAIIASMLDKTTIVDDAFEGYAAPATSMLAASPELVPEELRWDDDRGTDPVHPFYGSNGALDTDAVRDAFRDAGYRYNEAGELLARDQ
ncbi:ABC transporter substrate-binding protein [Halorubrum vacuolatum]|uniref:Peptide/nickel transport system substrate-binding protein n=1 Tax=Halorubrum vacuolatum TaxID=63740 RepID=A0A238WPJ3_HALVU|nr:ABC transporter substrate-binding protein [Halorubrum vacuolatum]SNR48530.1 peptide/nickel transport system substrate-binding protein [Halorubrum vacuolatum]